MRSTGIQSHVKPWAGQPARPFSSIKSCNRLKGYTCAFPLLWWTPETRHAFNRLPGGQGDNKMRTFLVMMLLIPSLFLLSGCDGGVSDELSQILSPTPRRGRLTLPGIDNIPLARISQTNKQMRGLWAATDHYSSVNGSREHGRLIRRTSCWSYIVECEDPEETASRPFTYFQNYNRSGDYEEIDYADAGLAFVPQHRRTNAWFKREIDNAGIRLVSLSILPDGHGLVGQYGDALDFLVVHSAGNEKTDAFHVRPDDPLYNGIKHAVDAGKVVYVAGYTVDGRGDIVRHPHSSGCDTVSSACVWVPFVTPGVGSGTSFGSPRVAGALASVLAVFPNTAHQNLARMLKTSVRQVSTLPNGLGVVDFTRLTTLGASGEWRLVNNNGEFNDAVAPLQLNHVTLPGSAAITSDFAISSNAEAVTFGTVLTGAFGRTTPGVLTGFHEHGTPVVAGVGEGLSFRLSQPNGDLYAGGVYEHEASNLFASAGLGIRNDFFGLDERYDYDRTLGYEANVGHRDLFFRVSRQVAQGRENGLIESAEGTAIGFTARRSFDLSKGMRVDAALNLDKFAGGEAKTVFGDVRMDESNWNRTLSVHLVHQPSSHAVFTAGAEVFSPAQGDDVFTAGVKLSVQFQPTARRDGFRTSNASHRGASDNFGPVAMEIFR